MKHRSKNSQTEREGVLAAASACNDLGLIWRDILQEDVGVDATVELTRDGHPTGKLIGVQVKSGTSYIRAETEDGFKFYPSPDDLDYWRRLTLPLFLFVYDPRTESVYWLDVQRYMENRQDDPMAAPTLSFRKNNVVDDGFRQYLNDRFDLTVYSFDQFTAVRNHLESLVYEDAQITGGSARVSALDLFLKGLWGLCSKLQFHLTLLTEVIRDDLVNRFEPSMVTYDLSRQKLFPFLNGYFAALGEHHLATLDYEDMNYSLYSKLEWPTFIAPLTLNGRRFVEYMRRELEGQKEVSDQQFFSLRLHPHTQIEVYTSFNPHIMPTFGPYVDVITIQFNRYLDYYYLVHLSRPSADGKPTLKAAQLMFYYELTDYLAHVLREVPKDNINCRHQDMAISPLICWLERFLEFEVGIPVEELAVTPTSERIAFSEELTSILSPVGNAFTRFDESMPDFRFITLASGEPLF